MMLNKYLILLILLFSQCNLSEAQAEGQKAHFQVHNKEQGKMEIHATKQKAKVSGAQIFLCLCIARQFEKREKKLIVKLSPNN